ncbi:hypothetical protein I316_02065 [Kwoniella heveanensis BCC8398]|uniref:Metallo-beta-lactamase domain-containing protein n=1 Tax=Kwoniella heveanensis BCC8398 TaxID=1296120 RepID=A0A1B9GYW8_9TREE|nr:hypothetical protein I316_02065 [Kwoniella heveanensis BCC8398]
MAGIYNGHLLEFPTIRVDCFLPSSSSNLLPQSDPSTSDHPYPLQPAPNAQLFLLTHVHSDHLLGLSDSFTGKIICSPDTKRMLLKLEPEIERSHLENGVKEVRRLKYPRLRARVKGKGKEEKLVDRIEAVPYGHPREFEIGYKGGAPQRVTITLLDANHCPGSTMFLITSPEKAVLHTGDLRADKSFIQHLKRESALQHYLAASSTYAGLGNCQPRAGRRVLNRIYLDTSAMLGTGDMPDREPVLQDLVEQMSLYPPDTIFFLDTWCFGWEFVIKEVSRYFGEKIHIDRYKHSIYKAIETDPYLLACTTNNAASTRFHACERFAKCAACRRFEIGDPRPVYNLDKRIVSVNMVEIKEASWALEHQSFVEALGKAAIGEGPWPYTINVPLARHSPLPELQNLVKLFHPKAVSPNTVVPSLRGMDYFLLPDFLLDCVAYDAYEGMKRERDLYLEGKYGLDYVLGLQSLQTRGMDAAQIEDKPAQIPRSSQSSSRLSIARDQISRASGLPALAPDELVKLVFNNNAFTTDHPGVLSSKGPAHYDYDTDEESPRNHKRRRRDFARDESGSLEPEASPSISIVPAIKKYPSPKKAKEERDRLHIYGKRTTSVDTKPTFGQGSASPAIKSVATSRRANQSTAGARPKQRSRFSLGTEEQDRIRCLMRKDRELLMGVGDSSEIMDNADTLAVKEEVL